MLILSYRFWLLEEGMVVSWGRWLVTLLLSRLTYVRSIRWWSMWVTLVTLFIFFCSHNLLTNYWVSSKYQFGDFDSAAFYFLFQVSKQFFPDVAVGYDDPRVALHIGDGTSSNTFPFLFFYLLARFHVILIAITLL